MIIDKIRILLLVISFRSATKTFTQDHHRDFNRTRLATMPKAVASIGEYSILPVSIPETSAYAVKAVHSIYVRPHAPKIPTASDSRSLFLVNIPIDSTEQHIRSIFSSLLGAGRFETVIFENERQNAPLVVETKLVQSAKNKKRKHADAVDNAETAEDALPKAWDRNLHRSGSTAVAVLADARCVEHALKAIKKANKSGEYPVWGAGVSGVPALGSSRYMAHQKLTYPPKDELQSAVDNFMAEWNRKEEEAARLAKRQRNVPDEDGFITVTRGGRTGPARQHDADEARKKELEKEEAKRKSMGDFYRFQGRERRKEEQGELLKRFEEDRKRVEGMKTERRGRFRPE
jgi:ribosomal RNA-processing protein 7